MPTYTGRGKKTVSTNTNKMIDWFIYTVVMGALPLIMKIILSRLFSLGIGFQDLCAELFFLSIVFFVDALKNWGTKSGVGKVLQIVLIICAFLYGLVLCNDYDIYKTPLSDGTITTVIVAPLLGGFVADLFGNIAER